ncbi:TMEM175 family protein [Terrimonas alba]|uniref:TMEM175 family protein n=1 Tax=Terrimonas alba TaxID=3349636 RepID=UPI0035F32BDC
MTKNRMEAFSDGVLAIVITIMVLEMKVPHGGSLQSLKPLIPVFLSYVLSFIYIGIYWNNHHHMLHTAQHVNGTVLWANMHLLFWLSLFPFVTGWMGENNFATIPVALYGVVAALAGIAYYLLAHSLAGLHGKNSPLAIALGKDWKGVSSIIMYLLGVGLSFLSPWLGLITYALVACVWFVPDKRMERQIRQND